MLTSSPVLLLQIYSQVNQAPGASFRSPDSIFSAWPPCSIASNEFWAVCWLMHARHPYVLTCCQVQSQYDSALCNRFQCRPLRHSLSQAACLRSSPASTASTCHTANHNSCVRRNWPVAILHDGRQEPLPSMSRGCFLACSILQLSTLPSSGSDHSIFESTPAFNPLLRSPPTCWSTSTRGSGTMT